MKKIVLTSVAIFASAMLVHAQGYISLGASIKGTVQTNGTSIGEGSGSASFTTGPGYDVEVLDMTSNSWTALTPSQQSGADNLLQNPNDVSLWTDSGISGSVGQGTSAGEITTETGGTAGASAANWALPPGPTYNTAANVDYYVVVGWSVNEGPTWAQVASALNGGTLGAGWFGSSVVAFNYAGNPTVSLNAVSAWGSSTVTGLAGSGFANGDVAGDLVLTPVTTVPEPGASVLACLGGLSMLFLRRRKN